MTHLCHADLCYKASTRIWYPLYNSLSQHDSMTRKSLFFTSCDWDLRRPCHPQRHAFSRFSYSRSRLPAVHPHSIDIQKLLHFIQSQCTELWVLSLACPYENMCVLCLLIRNIQSGILLYLLVKYSVLT